MDSLSDVEKTGKALAVDAYGQTVQSVNFGFTIAAALAWNEALRGIVASKFNNSSNSKVMVALAVTFAATLSIFITRKVLKKDVKRFSDL